MKDSAGKSRIRVRVEGRVQGVFFRASALDEAVRLGVTGWARNLPDGSVEIVAEGDKGALDAFVAWCHRGPPRARVERVRVEHEEFRNEFSGFRVR
ncbi:MAG TPA: acylphosphatase [Candidatus Acidoferrales bacterium]|nr:acylphosphatase [Candidatus Acidoferrales bacterium]